MPPDFLYSIGLTKVLELFGRHFTEHAQQIPRMAAAKDRSDADWERRYPGEAA